MTRKRGFKHFYLKGLLDVDPVSGCWIFLGCQNKEGYGRISRKTTGKARGNKHGWQCVGAHVYFFELYRQLVPQGLELRHRCHRRSCVNPHHLAASTKLENVADWFVDQKFTEDQRKQVAHMLAADLPLSVIADRMCAPRPYIARLARELDWHKHQTSFDFFEEETWKRFHLNDFTNDQARTPSNPDRGHPDPQPEA